MSKDVVLISWSDELSSEENCSSITTEELGESRLTCDVLDFGDCEPLGVMTRLSRTGDGIVEVHDDESETSDVEETGNG